jgi:adenine-specific DNA methylase
MLENGLATVLNRRLQSAKRFVDLFSGSAAVAIHVALKKKIPVRSVDLQDYSAALARAVITRNAPFCWRPSWHAWLARAADERGKYRVPAADILTRKSVAHLRSRCRRSRALITRCYGGHYFSPKQAIWIDSLRNTLPKAEPGRSIGLAALIRVASQCAASPGHTAQPFQPTRTAKQFIADAWSRDVVERTRQEFKSISNTFAQRCGSVAVGDANTAAKSLRAGDLVFIDPPYSGVHYSRFYHVLETIARGECGKVSGIGRYPAFDERPWSRFSVSSEAKDALGELFRTVSAQRARTIVTFPVHKCSNGLSGRIVRNLARKYFSIEEQKVESLFSSLGGIGQHGNGSAGRDARVDAKELILVLKPKITKRKRRQR